jgi:hypothetical protein
LISPATGEDIIPLDFATCVRERMPEWVKEVIRNASPRQAENYDDLEREFQRLLNKYKVKVAGRRIDEQGEPSSEQKGQELGAGGNGGRGGRGGAGTRNTRRRFHETPEGATVTALYQIYFRVGKATVYALAKRANADWGEPAMTIAFSKESLSIAADNYDESLPFVKRNVRDRIKLEKLAA